MIGHRLCRGLFLFALLAEFHHMVEDRGMQRMFESAARFMRACPEDLGASRFEAGKHDPQIASDDQFHEALKPKARDRHIGYTADKPRFSGSSHFDADEQVTALGEPALLIEFRLSLRCHV